ncbi:unnamed protein product [Cylicostephanus goldi]|uniref:Uncharacterized protein n=1 Tax=Cylicostephanus goldi TaxID=71465 RepID=A0A3P6QBM4_CYLGO|nr:unnamed protein product [Cylicostephanus goldi]
MNMSNCEESASRSAHMTRFRNFDFFIIKIGDLVDLFTL